LLNCFLQDYDSPGWAASYNAAEDQLLWQNQSQLQHLCLRGSARLGGFLADSTVGAELLAQLPASLPQLQTIELMHCPDLTVQQLLLLAGSGTVQSLVVQQCAGVTDADCLAAELARDGRLQVWYQA
jgi:hypothetical protein